jgi:Ni/Fe-hydrogenase subunit HybB-like protein
MQYKWFKLLLVMSVVALVVGAPAMYARLTQGLEPVAFGSYVPWGLWVAFYLFFLGLSAGAFLITILTYVVGMKRFESIGPLSAFTVLVALLLEVQFILYDLGTMHRALYQFFLTPSFTSLLTWMFVLFNAMFIIYLFKTYFLIRGSIIHRAGNEGSNASFYRLLALGRTEYDESMRLADKKRVHRLAWISLPVGLFFYGINGAFFAVVMNRPIWNNAFTPLLFILAALLSGGALITFLIHVFFSPKKPAVAEAVAKTPTPACESGIMCMDLGRIVLFLLFVFLLLEGMQFFIGYQTARLDIVTALDHMVTGSQAWTFWVAHLLVGSLIPIILLIRWGHNPSAVAWACFLIVITFPAVRYNFIVPDLAVYKLEGLGAAFAHERLTTDYAPNLNEWMVSIWVMGTGLLAFVLGTRYLPIFEAEGGHHG